jgi:glycosyltransferase involved in cell wall biosynthesis
MSPAAARHNFMTDKSIDVCRSPVPTQPQLEECIGAPPPQKIAYVIGFRRRPLLMPGIMAGQLPCPEYILFLQRNRARLITYDDVEEFDGEFARILQERRLLIWGPPPVVFDTYPRFNSIIAGGEDVGLPLAVYSKAHNFQIPINIITHGFIFEKSEMVRSIQNLPFVRFLCLSDSVRETMIKRFDLPESRVLNAGYGVDTDFFHPTGTPVSPPVIVSAGTANRDYRTLLRAIRPLNVQVRIAADSEWYPEKVDISRDVLPPNVELRSYLNYSYLRELYSRAFLVVVPLYPALFACGYSVIAEAMAMGKPVIATRTDSPSDFLIDGETGFFVKPGDADSLRERIEFLLSNPALAIEMGRRARERMEGLFSQAAYCRRLEQGMEIT